jgi:hypothetical protein
LVLVRKQPGIKAGAFSPALLVPVATTGTNGLYKPGLKAFFPPVHGPKALVSCSAVGNVLFLSILTFVLLGTNFFVPWS